jgi:hypothetical protein
MVLPCMGVGRRADLFSKELEAVTLLEADPELLVELLATLHHHHKNTKCNDAPFCFSAFGTATGYSIPHRDLK